MFCLVFFITFAICGYARIIHEYVGLFSDPREDVYVYRQIYLRSALPVNLTMLFTKMVNASELFEFEGLSVYDPRCNVANNPIVKDFCTTHLELGDLPRANSPIRNYIPYEQFHPVRLGSPTSAHTSSVSSPYFLEETKLCFKNLREFQDAYTCWTGSFLYLWNRTLVSDSTFKLQLFRIQLIAIQSSLDFSIKLDYDEEGDVYWKRIYNIKNNFVRHMSCDFRSPGIHDPDFCKLPKCEDVKMYQDCISKKQRRRQKRQWDIASFAIATGAAVLAGLNRAEIEHLKGEISTLTAASKAHEEEVLKLSGKLISFMKTTNEAFDDVHNQIQRMATTTAEHMESLSKNMEYLLRKDRKLQLSVDSMSASINTLMKVLIVEIQNRVANYIDSIRLASIMYHEGRTHRIRSAISSKIITDDMLSRKQLKESLSSPKFLDSLRELKLISLLDENNLLEYLESPVYSAIFHNESFLEIAIKVPVRRLHDSLYAYRPHCLPVLHKTLGGDGFVKDYCPKLPYLIIYDTQGHVYYELEIDHRTECFHGSFSVCPAFLTPKIMSPLRGVLPCYIKRIESHPDNDERNIKDRCSDTKVLSDGSTELVITDSGKIYLSIVKDEAIIIGQDNSVHKIGEGDFIPVEARCGSRIISNNIEYKIPSMFCDKNYDVVIARHGPVPSIKFSRDMIISEDLNLAGSISNLYKILMSQHIDTEKPPSLPSYIGEEYMKIIKDSKSQRTELDAQLSNQIEAVKSDADHYKKKLDELHSELDIRQSYLFYFVIIGFVGACFLLLDIIFALLIGQTICGMVARWRRGDEIMRKKYSQVPKLEMESVRFSPFRPSKKALIQLKFLPKLKTSKNKLKGYIYLLTDTYIENFYDLSKAVGKEILVADDMIGSPDHCLKAIFELINEMSRKRITWIDSCVQNPDFPQGTTAYISYSGGIDVEDSLTFLSVGDTLKIISIRKAPPTREE